MTQKWKMPDWMNPFSRFCGGDPKIVEKLFNAGDSLVMTRVYMLVNLHLANCLVPPPNLGAALTAHNPPPSETI